MSNPLTEEIDKQNKRDRLRPRLDAMVGHLAAGDAANGGNTYGTYKRIVEDAALLLNAIDAHLEEVE